MAVMSNVWRPLLIQTIFVACKPPWNTVTEEVIVHWLMISEIVDFPPVNVERVQLFHLKGGPIIEISAYREMLS